MNNVLTLETNKYSIKIENFEGPLDLLCHLIDKNKMDIYDIKISEITDQYIEYINEMEKMNLELTSEFLIMASTLLYLKSKGLLPSQNEEEEEITEEELIRRIIEYKKYKEITKNFRENLEIYSKRFFRVQEDIKLPKQELESNYTQEIIPQIYSKILGDKVKEMFRELIRKPKFVFNKLYKTSSCNKQEVVTAFTGLLELSRRSKVLTTQEELFGDIIVEKNKKKIS